jgi:hypothetical protein
MCVYCMVGDHQFRYNPPWPNKKPYPTSPYIPAPLIPADQINPWSVERLKEYLELLKQIKALEDQIGCPCEPNKADYIKLFELRIKALEAKIKLEPKDKIKLKPKNKQKPTRFTGRTR